MFIEGRWGSELVLLDWIWSTFGPIRGEEYTPVQQVGFERWTKIAATFCGGWQQVRNMQGDKV